MIEKALVFVTGHRRPSVAPLTARYVRRFPDGSLMLAKSTHDTIENALARWENARTKPAKGHKKEADDAAG